MTPAVDVHQCDYLRVHSLPPPSTSTQAELIYIDEQITSLNTHISQLTALRKALQCRSRRLYNSLSPIQNLPFEILSYIFQQHIDPDDYLGLYLHQYQRDLSQAFVLCWVSSHFRRVAFATSELWKSIPLYIPHVYATRTASSLLEHCIALTPCVSISVSDKLTEEEDARSAVDILLSPDVIRKVKNFELFSSVNPAVWVNKFEGSSFPVLDALTLTHQAHGLRYNFGTLKTLTRLSMPGHSISHPVIIPSSMQYLYIAYITPQTFLAVVQQCSNLVEFQMIFDLSSDDLDYTPFTELATLNNLKRMDVHGIGVVEMSELLEMIRLPSLEHLQLEHYEDDKFVGAYPVFRDGSATLTTLIIEPFSNKLHSDDLYRMCTLPFPRLKRLEFRSDELGPFANVIRALALLDGENCNSETHHLPALTTILLRCCYFIKPRTVVRLLRKWRIGVTFHVDIRFINYRLSYRDWPPDLRGELESLTVGRRVEIEWGHLQLV